VIERVQPKITSFAELATQNVIIDASLERQTAYTNGSLVNSDHASPKSQISCAGDERRKSSAGSPINNAKSGNAAKS